ncbi:hypothetical protein DSECCO2_625010 [anaerobic digester metagenome]
MAMNICEPLLASAHPLSVFITGPYVWSAPIGDVANVAPMPFIALGSYAGMAWPLTAGTCDTPRTFPVIVAPQAKTFPNTVPFIISSIILNAEEASPNCPSPASMATPMAAPTSMVSIPRSLHIAFNFAIASKSPIPRFDPIKPIVSYSSGETIVLPSLSGTTFEH